MVFFPLRDINPRITFPFITVLLIVANIAVYIFSLQDFEYFIFNFGYVPAQATLVTALTAMFLHGGLDHILGNMWYLWIFGDNVEGVFGWLHYLLFYLLAGAAATLAHHVTNFGSLIPAIGASGAISGVLGAYLVFFPKIKVKVYARYLGVTEISAFGLLIFWFMMQLLFSSVTLIGNIGSGVAFAAHAGGFAFGYAYAWVFKRFFPNRIPEIVQATIRPQEGTSSAPLP
jgi:membrane associated rhomboid family serine protease